MAVTYVLIASNTLTSDTATVTFSSIPGTYTDLVVKWSARDTWSDYASGIFVTFNGTTTNYSDTHLTGLNGASQSVSSRNTNAARIEGFDTAATATSSAFSLGELYITNYLASSNKSTFMNTMAENNSQYNVVLDNAAGLWRNTSAITEIKFSARSNFATNSSFWLYGIKNS